VESKSVPYTEDRDCISQRATSDETGAGVQQPAFHWSEEGQPVFVAGFPIGSARRR